MKHCVSTFVFTVTLLTMFGQSQAFSQSSKDTDNEEDKYTSAMCYGVTTSTTSSLIGGFCVKSVKRLNHELFGHSQFRYLSFEVLNIKHPKESPFTNSLNARYVFGKTNYLFTLRTQYGREIVLSSRNADEGISINAIVALGPSLGVLKPYYIRYESGQGKTATQIQVQYDPLKHNPINIIGAGDFLKGFNNSTVDIGVNGKVAFNFELSAFRNNTTGIEIGFLVEAFAKKAPIMATIQGNEDINKALFSSAYITLFFGNRK